MKRLIPSMFHRRLTLIGGAYALAIAALGAQLANLTLVKGDALRAQAEARLAYSQWTPTTRGQILDRKGRVLARDRACYHVAIDYPVLTGLWARLQALEYARALHQSDWRRLSIAERDALVALYQPAFQQHLDAAWARLAQTTAVDPTELAQDRQAIVTEVEAMATHLRTLWVDDYLAEHARTGRNLEPDDQRRLRRLESQETAEQLAPHILIRAIPDETAFTLLRLADQTVPLDPADSGKPIIVPILPGLHVEDGATREYPFESVILDVDQSTLPLPLRTDARRSVAAVGVLADLLGWMGTPTDVVIDRRQQLRESDPAFVARTTVPGLDGPVDLGQYLPGDLAGTRGIEARYEPILRGLRGQSIIRRDTDEHTDTPPTPGRDITLTIDAMLQARVQAAMSPDLGLARVQAWHANHALPSGADLAGAAIILDVDTGEILAMVSTPGVTQADRRRAESRVQDRVRAEANRRAAHEDDPRLAAVPYTPAYDPRTDPDALLRYNRAVSVAYAPGSIAKVVILLEAVRQGSYSLAERIACTGHLLERTDALRCWIFKRFQVTHNTTLGHDLSAPEALTASCNIFFYTLGRRLGPDAVNDAYTRWGVGTPYDLGPPAPSPGITDIDDTGQAILAGIGQGPVTWTPMHAADALATIARAGIRIPPTLVQGDHSTEPVDLNLDPAAIHAVIQGLDGAVHDSTHGTGHHITFTVASDGRTLADGSTPATRDIRDPIFNIPGVRVVGKTGTATAGPIQLLDEHDRPILDDAGNIETVVPDHSWYVALVGPETGPSSGRLRYAIAVMMENAGSGGKVSGPICNQIIAALVEEGYLPSADSPATISHADPRATQPGVPR